MTFKIIFFISTLMAAVACINQTEQDEGLFEKPTVIETQAEYYSIDEGLLKDLKDDPDQQNGYYSHWLADKWPFAANTCGNYGRCCSLRTGEMIDYFKDIYPVFEEDCAGTPCVELDTQDVCVSQPLNFDDYLVGEYLSPGLYQNFGTMMYVSPVQSVDGAERIKKRSFEATSYVSMKITNQNMIFSYIYYFDGNELTAFEVDVLLGTPDEYRVMKLLYQYYLDTVLGSQGSCGGTAGICGAADTCGEEETYRAGCCEKLCCDGDPSGCCRYPNLVISQLGWHSGGQDHLCSSPDVGDDSDWDELGACTSGYTLSYAGFHAPGYGFGMSSDKKACVYAYYPFEKSFEISPSGIKPVPYGDCTVCV